MFNTTRKYNMNTICVFKSEDWVLTDSGYKWINLKAIQQEMCYKQVNSHDSQLTHQFIHVNPK